MRKNLSLWMLGIAAVLASCSSEDTLQGTNDNDGLVRITVQLEDGMKTRATTPEEDGESAGVTRYVLSAYETDEDGTSIGDKATDVVITDLGGGNFTAKLDRQKYYKFFCWADEGESSSYDITGDDLTNIALKQNTDGTGYMLPTIAHRGESDVVYGETAGDVTIQLKHAVAKVILQTTGTLTAGSAKLETKTCTSYNAVTNEYDYNTKASVSESGPESAVTGSEDAPAKVLQFYVLTGRTTEDVTLTYNTSYTKNLNSVSFENDYRTIFVGDIAGLQWNTASVTATLDDNWDEDINIKDATFDVNTHTITTHLEGQIADNPDLIKSAIDGGTSLAVTGPMNDGDLTAIADYLKENSGTTIGLDLSEAELTSVPDLTFGSYFDDEAAQSLGQVNLPTTLTEIGGNAFRYCNSFTIANWDELVSLTTIKSCAFMGSGLSGDITLPESITAIEGMAFYQTNITSIVFPSSITTVGIQMLYRCYSLKKVVFKGDVKSLDEIVFGACSALEEIDFSACTSMPTYKSNPFADIVTSNINKITLKVKAELVESFKGDENWGKCNVIAAE